MKRNNLLSSCAIALCMSLLLCVSMSAQDNAAQAGVLTSSEFNRAVHFDVSPPLRDLLDSQPVIPFGFHEAPPVLQPKLQKQLMYAAQGRQAPAGQLDSEIHAPVIATVGVNELGVGVGFHGYSVPDAPTDVNMASGDWPGNQANAQVVQWVNVSYAVFRKSDGAYLAGPILGQTLWSGFNGACASANSGDIIAQFDKQAHRWVLFQPLFSGPPFGGCFAISTSPDALGTYFRYEFPMNQGFPDYPKLGIQPEAYYQSNNMFNNSLSAYIGAMPCAYNRAKMLTGDPTAEQICTLDNSNGTLFDDSMLPADLDSPDIPMPPGTPEVFVGSIDNFASETNIYEYTYKPNFTTLTAVLTGVNGSSPIPTGLPAFVNAGTIPQAGIPDQLGSLGDRLMYRLVLRRTPTPSSNNLPQKNNIPINHWLVSHAIVNAGSVAERWYEFRSPDANKTALQAYQGGTYAPDATYRWMGSLAMDKMGNIALGYSRSSPNLHPDIYFTGRVSFDALGTMEGEKAIVDQTVATGSQPDTANRWGDYTSMSIDLDGCTFWYTNQYYTVTTRFNWSTRVASLKFNDCTPTALK
jgi:hypothetical protein